MRVFIRILTRARAAEHLCSINPLTARQKKEFSGREVKIRGDVLQAVCKRRGSRERRMRRARDGGNCSAFFLGSFNTSMASTSPDLADTQPKEPLVHKKIRLTGQKPSFNDWEVYAVDSKRERLFLYGGVRPHDENFIPTCDFHCLDLRTMRWSNLTVSNASHFTYL